MRNFMSKPERYTRDKASPLPRNLLVQELWHANLHLTMRKAALKKHIDENVQQGHYIDAFILLSVYTESVVTALFIVDHALQQGYAGTHSYQEAIDMDPKVAKSYENKLHTKLSIKLKRLLDADLSIYGVDIGKDQFEKLDGWRKTRNDIFHNFIEKMLQRTIEKECEEAFNHLQEISEQEWFHNMEYALVRTEDSLPTS